jgi:ribosomal protein S18 acetylase RimI-like enzyme
MDNRRIVRPAGDTELRAAFELVFRHHSDEERQTRVGNALRLLRQREIDPSGVLVALDEKRLLGAMVCVPVPGAGAMIWPPQALVATQAEEIEDQLLAYAEQWLRGRGVKLAQAILLPQEKHLSKPLLRGGFRAITALEYLKHDLQLSSPWQTGNSGVRFLTYAQCDRDQFHRALLDTYGGTLDCPEVNGVRTVDEIIDGHRAQGLYDSARWWLALRGGEPAGVLLLTELPEWGGWDVSYLGVVPAARRNGIGTALAVKALAEAHTAGAAQLTLALDVRNVPASQLYRSLGFTPFDKREVYLAIWQIPPNST